MADARYVIDLIINARDNTAAAFASAMGNAEAFKRMQKDIEDQNKRTGDSMEEMAGRVKTSQTEMNKQMKESALNTKFQVEQAVALEKATRAHVRAQADASKSDLERLHALVELRNAANELEDTLTKAGRKDAKATTDAIVNSARRIEQGKVERQFFSDAAKQREAEMRKGAAMAKAIDDENAARYKKQIQELIALNKKAVDERIAEEKRGAEMAKAVEQSYADNYKAQIQWRIARNKQTVQERLNEERQGAIMAKAIEDSYADNYKRQIQWRIAQNKQTVQERLNEEKRGAEMAKAIEDSYAANYRQQIQWRINENKRVVSERLAEERQGAAMAKALEDQYAANYKQQIQRRIADNKQTVQERLNQERQGAVMAKAIEDLYAANYKQQIQRRIADNKRAVQERIDQEKQGAAMAKAIEDQNLSAYRQRIQNRLDIQKREAEAADKYVAKIKEIANLEKQRLEAEAAGQRVTAKSLQLRQEQARREAEVLAGQTRAAQARIPAGFDPSARGADPHFARLAAQKEALDGSEIEINVDLDAAAAIAQMLALRRATADTSNEMGFLRGLMTTLSQSFHKSSGTVSSFDNFLRGLMSLGIAVFFNQLILLAGAAASAFLALASSAAFAGAAIGGALTAGVAQAIPIVGLLVTAITRVAAVMEAAKQAALLEEQQSYQGSKQDAARANAIDQVRSAEERLADANRRVTAAQKEINKAREEAADKLRDLILQERGLSLTMEETQEAIEDAMQAGDVSALPRLQLQRDATRAQLGDVRGEIASRQEAGPGASPELQRAQEGLKDAQRSAVEAQRALDQAKRSAAEADAGITAAAGKLTYLLGQLSEAERRLYAAILKLKEAWRAFSQTATEPLINAFTDATEKITKLLQDPKILAAATSLATGLATQFTRVFDEFTSGQGLSQLLRIVEQSKDNLKPLGDIATNIGHAFLDIAEAAGPALTQILVWIGDITKNVADFFREGRKSGELADFFADGVVHLEAWGDLLWSILRLFGAIAGPGGGAETGLKMVQDMAEGIGKWADEIEKPGSKLNEFFNRFFDLGRKMLDAMGPVFTSLGDEINKIFTEDGMHAVEGFATFLADVLIPALGDFARIMGKVTGYIGDFAEAHPEVTKMAASILGATLAISVFMKAASIFTPILAVIGFIGKRMGILGKSMDDVAKAATRTKAPFAVLRTLAAALTGPIGIILLLIVGLIAISGRLDDVWRKIVETAKEIWEDIQPGIESVKKSFQGLVDTLQEGGGLISVLKWIGSFIADVLIDAIEAVGDIIGGVLNGAMHLFAGFMDFLNAILNVFQGDWEEAWESLKDAFENVFEGLKSIFMGVFEGLGGWIVNNFKRLFNLGKIAYEWVEELGDSIREGLIETFLKMVDIFVTPFEAAWNAVLKFFGAASPSKLAADLGKWIVEGLVAGIKGAARMVANGAKWLWDRFVGHVRNYIRAWTTIGRWVGDAIRDSIEKAKDLLSGVGKTVWNFIRDYIRTSIRNWKTIGTWIWNAISGAVEGVADKLKGVGKTIINAIADGIKSAPGVIKDALGWVIDHAPGIPGIFKDKMKDFLGLQEGGPVPGGYGGGDRIPAMLEPGEHVWTKEEVRRAGGQGVMFALRAMLGGGGQGGPVGYALGGFPGTSTPLDALGRPVTQADRTRARAEKQKEEQDRSGISPRNVRTTSAVTSSALRTGRPCGTTWRPLLGVPPMTSKSRFAIYGSTRPPHSVACVVTGTRS